MKNDEEKAMKKSTAGLLILLLLAPSALWTAYVGTRLWGWFVEPLGAPHLGVVRAVGIAVLIALYRRRDLKEEIEEEDGDELFAKFVAAGGFVPLVFLFVGWLCTQFL